jgi:hypothetical protein
MGVTMYLALGFIIGIVSLLLGIFRKEGRALKLTLIIFGAIISAVSLVIALFLVFILIPSM